MINIISKIAESRKIKAIKKANELAELTKKKHIVFREGYHYKIYSKQYLKYMIKTRQFKKGLTASDLEKKAAYVTL